MAQRSSIAVLLLVVVNPSKACSHPLDISAQCTVAVTIEFVLARAAPTETNNLNSDSSQQPPAIRFYPQRLPTTHVPSQDKHAAGVREVSEHTVCLVFHSQVTGHCTNSCFRTIAAQTLLMDLFHRIRLVNSPENEVQYKQC